MADKGDQEAALAEMERVYAALPGVEEVQLTYAPMLAARGELERALLVLPPLRARDGMRGPMWRMRGRILHELHEAIGALEAYQQAERWLPNDAFVARRIAERPTMAALLVKDSVNAAADAMGFTEALRHAFHIHELGHAHWAAANENRYPVGLPPDVPDWRTLGAPKLARHDEP